MIATAFAVAALLQPESFEASAGAFAACLRATVQMGMTTRMEPEQFRAGLARACLDEQARFRAAAIAAAISQGRSEAEAAAEVDGNIANGRRIFAADQESYVRTGRVPR